MVIDAKLAKEQMDEMRQLINARFGHGTFQQIIAERNKQIREEKERIAEQKRIAARKRKEMQDIMLVFGIAGGVAVVFVLAIVGFIALS